MPNTASAWDLFVRFLPYGMCLIFALHFSALAAPLAVMTDATKTGKYVWVFALVKGVAIVVSLGMLAGLLSIPAATTGNINEFHRVIFVIGDALGGLGAFAAIFFPLAAGKYLHSTQGHWFGYFSSNGRMALSVYLLMLLVTLMIAFGLVQVKFGW